MSAQLREKLHDTRVEFARQLAVWCLTQHRLEFFEVPGVFLTKGVQGHRVLFHELVQDGVFDFGVSGRLVHFPCILNESLDVLSIPWGAPRWDVRRTGPVAERFSRKQRFEIFTIVFPATQVEGV